MLPRLVSREHLSTAHAMFQALFQLGLVVGPATAGLLLAGAGIRFVYWLDVATFAVSIAAVSAIGAQPPAAGAQRAGLRSTVEGFRYVSQQQAIQGAYLIDINAMVFGMPRALFPALAAHVFGGGARTLGFLYSSVGAGALLGALTTGWVGRVRRQGLAVILAVMVWGAAISGFGVTRWLPGGLLLLAVAGWADVISAVFRNTMIQLVVTGGPRLGDLEAGAVATAFSTEVSVVSGGVACLVGAALIAWALPAFRRQEAVATPPPDR
jgi:MFS family permease